MSFDGEALEFVERVNGKQMHCCVRVSGTTIKERFPNHRAGVLLTANQFGVFKDIALAALRSQDKEAGRWLIRIAAGTATIHEWPAPP